MVPWRRAYPDLDARASSGAEPVPVGAEAQSVDVVTAVQGVQMFALVQVPQHGLTVLGGETHQSQTRNRTETGEGHQYFS